MGLPDWLKPGGGPTGPKSKPPSKPKGGKPKGGKPMGQGR